MSDGFFSSEDDDEAAGGSTPVNKRKVSIVPDNDSASDSDRKTPTPLSMNSRGPTPLSVDLVQMRQGNYEKQYDDNNQETRKAAMVDFSSHHSYKTSECSERTPDGSYVNTKADFSMMPLKIASVS